VFLQSVITQENITQAVSTNKARNLTDMTVVAVLLLASEKRTCQF
jgi:hypothetical protein